MDHFNANLLVADVLTKLTTIAILGLVENTQDSLVSTRAFRLSRAASTGDWLTELDGLLAQDIRRITVDTTVGQWLSDIDTFLRKAKRRDDRDALATVALPLSTLRANLLGLDAEQARISPIAMMRWLTEIRNKTVGHGALGANFWHSQTPTIEAAVEWLVRRTPLWAADLIVVVQSSEGPLGRTLRGVEPTGTMATDEIDLGQSGCRIASTVWQLPSLIWISPADNQTYIANGSWRESDASAELLCHSIAAAHASEGRMRRPMPAYAVPPPEPTAPSETEGASRLHLDGHVAENLPPQSHDYVRRDTLEDELRRVLSDPSKRHLVNVKGIGGSGKTSLVLRLSHELASQGLDCPYSQIIWISSREVDLTLRGPKPVRRAAGDLTEVWDTYCALWESSEDPKSCFEDALQDASSPALVVIDNFETFDDQEAAYAYFDDVVHPPSKVVITSRHDFRGDFQIKVRGMDRKEAGALIRGAARAADREGLVDEPVIDRIHSGCQGHPYAMKLVASNLVGKPGLTQLLGQVLSDSAVLEALFRASLDGISEDGEFVFLLVSRFDSGVSDVALRVAIAPEGLALDAAVQELRQRSLLDIEDDESLYSMPAMAREFAKVLAAGHVHGVSVGEAESYLRRWPGLVAGDVADAAQAMVASLSDGHREVRGRSTIGTLETIAESDSRGWLYLARGLRAVGGEAMRIDAAYKRAVEASPSNSGVLNEWSDSATDAERKLELKVQAVSANPKNFKLASNVAKLLSAVRAADKHRFSKLKWSSLMAPVAAALEDSLSQLDGNDCSRLAWLYLNMQEPDAAIRAVKHGQRIEPDNANIAKLVDRLDIGP